MYKKIQDSPNVNWFKFNKKKSKDENFSDVIKTFMGRDALNIFLWNISNQKKDLTALLPAYICSEVPDQFKRNNIKIINYDINSFQLSLEDIEPYLGKNIDIFYFVHYFGIYQKNIQDIIKKLKEINPKIIIIEDRAHYLSDEYILDEIDAVIYSFRKLLPIPEGGGLYSKYKLFYKKKPRILSNVLVLLVLLKKKLFGHNPKFSRSNVMKDIQKPSNELLLPSTFSEKVIKEYDIKENIQYRRKLFYEWKKAIENIDVKPVFNELEEKDIPQGFPIYVKDAEETFNRMLDKGIYLKRHWILSEGIKKFAPKSLELSKKVITLPIYENINNKDIELISTNLKN